MNTLKRIVAAATLALPWAAQATLISYGTVEFVTARLCIAGASGCDDVSRIISSSRGGLPGDAMSSASATFAGFGTAFGSVSLSGVVGAPILKASATSELGKRVNTNSIALQRYTYTGSAPSVRSFGGTLSYSQSLSGDYSGAVGAGINALIDIFSLPTATVDVASAPDAYFNDLFSHELFAGYSEIASSSYQDRSSTSSGIGTLSVSVALNPGDTVWVWTLLQTPAANGSAVDASHTLVTAWSNPADLTAAAVAVPEPAGLGWICLGLAVVGMTRRRQVG